MTDTPQEHRRFSRVNFPADVTVRMGDQNLDATLIDISLHGALVELPTDAPQPEHGSHCELTLQLNGTIAILIKLRIVHQSGQRFGGECSEIDLDSLTHLKQLVSYNLGDQALLERQLGELIFANNPPEGED